MDYKKETFFRSIQRDKKVISNKLNETVPAVFSLQSTS